MTGNALIETILAKDSEGSCECLLEIPLLLLLGCKLWRFWERHGLALGLVLAQTRLKRGVCDLVIVSVAISGGLAVDCLWGCHSGGLNIYYVVRSMRGKAKSRLKRLQKIYKLQVNSAVVLKTIFVTSPNLCFGLSFPAPPVSLLRHFQGSIKTIHISPSLIRLTCEKSCTPVHDRFTWLSVGCRYQKDPLSPSLK